MDKMHGWRSLFSLVVVLIFVIISFPMLGHAKLATSGETQKSITKTVPIQTGNNIGTTMDNKINSYPTMTAITANYVTDDGAITNETTLIKMTFTNSLVLGSSDSSYANAVLSKVYGDVVTLVSNDVPGKTVSSSTSDDLVKSASKTLSFGNGTTVSVAVNLKNLANLGRLYFGLRAIADKGAYPEATFKFGEYKPAVLQPTINNTVTGESSSVNSTDTEITGKCTDGSTISTTIDGKTYSGTVTDGKYSISIPDGIGKVNSITVIEINEQTGAKGTVDASVVSPKVTISSKKSSFSFSPADIDNFDSSKLINWICEQAGVEGSSSSGKEVKYELQESTALQSLHNLAVGNKITMHIKATDGTDESDYLPVEITKDAGELVFGKISTLLSFGEHEVPAGSIQYAPTAALSIPITDTRDVGAGWTLTARTSGLSGANGGNFVGNIMYQGTDGNPQKLSNAALTIDRGYRVEGQTSINPANKWSFEANNKWINGDTGIYLNVLPGTTIGTYSGTIEWSLIDSYNP